MKASPRGDRFACGTESGSLLVGDLGPGFEDRSRAMREALDEEERQQVDSLEHSYYLNFPQRNPEKAQPKVLLPCGEYQVYQNSIFDLIWLRGSDRILTASGGN